MNATATALLLYVTWTIALVSLIAIVRSVATLGGKAANSFAPDGHDVSAFSARLCRAHANCYESFPFVGGLLLFALATGQTAVTDPLAYLLIAARVAQSLIHLASTAVPAVLLRFAAMLAQIVIALWWLAQFFGLV